MCDKSNMLKLGLFQNTFGAGQDFDRQQANLKEEQERIQRDQASVKQGNCPPGFTQTGPNMTCVQAVSTAKQAEFDAINAKIKAVWEANKADQERQTALEKEARQKQEAEKQKQTDFFAAQQKSAQEWQAKMQQMEAQKSGSPAFTPGTPAPIVLSPSSNNMSIISGKIAEATKAEPIFGKIAEAPKVGEVQAATKEVVPAGIKQDGGFLKMGEKKGPEADLKDIGKGLFDKEKAAAKDEPRPVRIANEEKNAPDIKKIVDSFGKPGGMENVKEKIQEMEKRGVPPPKDDKDMEDLKKGLYRPEGKEIPGTGLIESIQKDLSSLQSMLGKLIGGKGSGYTAGELCGSSNCLIAFALVIAVLFAMRR